MQAIKYALSHAALSQVKGGTLTRAPLILCSCVGRCIVGFDYAQAMQSPHGLACDDKKLIKTLSPIARSAQLGIGNRTAPYPGASAVISPASPSVGVTMAACVPVVLVLFIAVGAAAFIAAHVVASVTARVGGTITPAAASSSTAAAATVTTPEAAFPPAVPTVGGQEEEQAEEGQVGQDVAGGALPVPAVAPSAATAAVLHRKIRQQYA